MGGLKHGCVCHEDVLNTVMRGESRLHHGSRPTRGGWIEIRSDRFRGMRRTVPDHPEWADRDPDKNEQAIAIAACRYTCRKNRPGYEDQANKPNIRPSHFGHRISFSHTWGTADNRHCFSCFHEEQCLLSQSAAAAVFFTSRCVAQRVGKSTHFGGISDKIGA